MGIEREEDSNVRGDAFKTLFVARLSYDTTEKDLEREFGRFGPIERVSHTWLLMLVFSRVVRDSLVDGLMASRVLFGVFKLFC